MERNESNMELIFSACIGYGLGCLSPSYLLSKLNKKDLREHGSGNLGATNAFLHLGKKAGVLIMVFDILKAMLAVKLCQILFPRYILAGIIGGFMAVVGHVFPFYLEFKGGKGLACFGGFVLATDWKWFLILLTLGIILALIFNYGCAIPFSAATIYPFAHLHKAHNIQSFMVLAMCSMVVIYKHIDNIKKIRAGEELPVRTFLKTKLFDKKEK